MSTDRRSSFFKTKLLIRTKLLVSAVITIGLALAVVLTVSLQYWNMEEAVRTEHFAHRVIKDVSDLNSLSYAYLLLKDKRPKVQWQLKHTALGKLLSEGVTATPDDQDLILRLRSNHERMKGLFDVIVKRTEESRGSEENAASLYDELNEGAIAQLLARSELMVNDASLLGRESTRRMNTVQRRSFFLVLASALLLIVSAALTAFLLAKSIGGSLRRLEHGTQRIAAGDLACRVEVGGNDEISRLAAAFNDMTAKLQTSYHSLELEIGERKRAEEALKRLNQTLEQRIDERTVELAASEQRWATTLASIGDAVIATDASGRIVFLNKVAQALTGWQPEEAVGQPLQAVFRIVNEKTLQPRADTAQRVLQEGLVIALANDTALITRSGQTIPIEDSAAPIKDRKGDITGVVLVFHDVGERRRAQEALRQRTLELQQLTGTLEERVQERTAELADLTAQLVSAQEKERERISYELHDNVWQNLVAIRFAIENLFSAPEDQAALKSNAEQITSNMLDTVEKIRSMQGDLWPYVLDDIGLVATIEWYCREFEKDHPGLAITITNGVAETDIPPAVKIVIYRILQEALDNVAKHSQAGQVTIRLTKRDRGLALAIADDGVGFDPEEAIAKKAPWGGLGLLSIKARAELSGGALGVESAMGKGTTVSASWSFGEEDGSVNN